jgi:hypothetical protein
MAPVELHPFLEPARWARIALDPTRWRVAEGYRGRSSPERERSAAWRSPLTGNGQIRLCPGEVMM